MFVGRAAVTLVDVPASQHPDRPVRTPNIDAFSIEGASDTTERLELAYATASKAIAAGRGEGSDADLIRLAETVGLETLAELWRHAPLDSLPGALWCLYLVRVWCASHGEEVARFYRAGRGLAPVDEVVAGAQDQVDPAAMGVLADAVLRGVYRGDLAVALERAASFFRVVAEGRAAIAHDGDETEHKRAARNRGCAESLQRAAAAWRAGTLTE